MTAIAAPLANAVPESPLATHLADQTAALRNRVYARGSVRGASGKELPIAPTGMAQAAGEHLRSLVGAERPGSTIETGLAFALSTTFILEACLRTSGAARHVAIDAFQSTHWDDAGRILLRETGLEPLCQVI